MRTVLNGSRIGILDRIRSILSRFKYRPIKSKPTQLNRKQKKWFSERAPKCTCGKIATLSNDRYVCECGIFGRIQKRRIYHLLAAKTVIKELSGLDKKRVILLNESKRILKTP